MELQLEKYETFDEVSVFEGYIIQIYEILKEAHEAFPKNEDTYEDFIKETDELLKYSYFNAYDPDVTLKVHEMIEHLLDDFSHYIGGDFKEKYIDNQEIYVFKHGMSKAHSEHHGDIKFQKRIAKIIANKLNKLEEKDALTLEDTVEHFITDYFIATLGEASLLHGYMAQLPHNIFGIRLITANENDEIFTGVYVI